MSPVWMLVNHRSPETDFPPLFEMHPGNVVASLGSFGMSDLYLLFSISYVKECHSLAIFCNMEDKVSSIHSVLQWLQHEVRSMQP